MIRLIGNMLTFKRYAMEIFAIISSMIRINFYLIVAKKRSLRKTLVLSLIKTKFSM